MENDKGQRGGRGAQHPATTHRYSPTRDQLHGWSWELGGRGRRSDGENRKLGGEGYRRSPSQEFKKKKLREGEHPEKGKIIHRPEQRQEMKEGTLSSCAGLGEDAEASFIARLKG